MKLTVVAATGGIGQHVLDGAIAAGHDVTAVVRNPARLPTGVRSVRVDLATASAEDLAPAIESADAVLSGLGPRSAADVGVVAAGTGAIVTAMRAARVRRIVVVSAAPIGTVAVPGRPKPPRHDPGDGIVMRYVLTPIVKRLLRNGYADLAAMEAALRESGLEWTVVRPPRLTDKPPTGAYRTALDRNLRRGMTVSRADVAALMLDALTRPDLIGRCVGVAD
jgi:putative NADH-flavin reductase